MGRDRKRKGAGRRGGAGKRGRTRRRPDFAPAPDPFGWAAERKRQAAGLPATPPPAGWKAIQPSPEPARDVDELQRRMDFLLSDDEGDILFALLEWAADPHLTQAPGLTVQQWAHYLNIPPPHVTAAFRELHRLGIPKLPAPIPLDGLLRFLADREPGGRPGLAGPLAPGRPPERPLRRLRDGLARRVLQNSPGGDRMKRGGGFRTAAVVA